MSISEQSPKPPPKLVTLKKAFNLAEQWVKNMAGDAEEEVVEPDMEARPLRLGLGAKVARKFQVGPLNDPVASKLHQKLDVKRRKRAGDEEPTPTRNIIVNDDSDDEENLDSRTNAFANKRPVPNTIPQQSKKKQKRK